MTLEGIAYLIIVAIIVIILLFVLLHLLGHVFFIAPEAGVTYHQFMNYGDLLSHLT